MLEAAAREILVFTRYPRPGQSKTRLIPAIGEKNAADLQRRMTEFTVDQARKTNARVEVRYTEGKEEEMRNWLGNDLSYIEQGEGDLGKRLAKAFEQRFAAGASHVAAVGSDCPDNRADNMVTCFEALEKYDWAIGPAVDGGYYMLGLKQPSQELFTNIDWGGDKVLAQTLATADSVPFFMPELNDVDIVEDIPTGISVIIPTFNEADRVNQTINSIFQGFNTECIVVDGGSEDDTEQRAVEHGAKFFRSAPGRAVQMNYGAEKASGPLLLFAHADTTLPANWDKAVRKVLQDKSTALGSFRLQVRERVRGISWIERGAYIRSRFLHQPYGDQGLFMRLADFQRAGGYPELPIMEDVELVRRLRDYGRTVTLSNCVLTSCRRWKRLGVLRTTLYNQLVISGYILGIAPERLARFYRGKRRKKG